MVNVFNPEKKTFIPMKIKSILYSIVILNLLFSSFLFAESNDTAKSRASYWASGGENIQEVKQELPFIERDALFQKIKTGTALFIDTRTPKEFQVSHLPNALNVPYTEIAERIPEIEKKTAKETVVIPYCNWDFRAYIAGIELKSKGIPNVQMMYPHGLKGWQANGLPLAGNAANTNDETAQKSLLDSLAHGLSLKESITAGYDLPKKSGVTQHVAIQILKKKVEPRHIRASVGDHLILDITAEEEDHWFVMPDFDVNLKLKQGEKKTVEINLTKSGYFPYGCITCCTRYQCQVRQAILVDLKEDPSFYGE